MHVLNKADIDNFVRHARSTQETKNFFGTVAAQECRGGNKLFEIARDQGFLEKTDSDHQQIAYRWAYKLDLDDNAVAASIWKAYQDSLTPAARDLARNGKRKAPATGIIARLNRIENKLDELLAARRNGS